MNPVVQTVRFLVPHPPARIWPVLSHTDWLNRVMGLPPVSYFSEPLPQGGVTLEARSKLLPGPPIRWKEYPFEWVKEKYFTERRVYLNGPFEEFFATFNMEGRDGQTDVEISARIVPRHVGGAVIARLLTQKMRWDFRKVRRSMEEFLVRPEHSELPSFSRQPTNEKLLDEGLVRLRASGWRPQLLEKLRSFLSRGSDAEVVKIRAFRIADIWNEDRWEVLRLFLHATRAGLVDLSWEVLCPNCRGDRQPKGSLGDLRGKVHCPSCQIAFDSEFDQSVELKFAIDPAVRPVRRDIFCIGGPGQNSFLVAQLSLEGGETKQWKLAPLEGRYRLRSPQAPGGASIIEIGRSGAGAKLAIGATGWEPAPPRAVARELTLENRLAQDAAVLLEREDWNRDVATAALVTGWQEFKDLFSKEVLAPGEEITVGRQILLFTDLRGSTSLYQRIGDAPAYSRVREHFRVIEYILSRHHGGLVKTIGDAIMATFSSVREALDAVAEMHERIGGLGGGLRLKAGLHLGPCIAVNANERLDYFGSTVNLAARLTPLCGEDEAVLSDDFMQSGETQEWLKKKGFHSEDFTAELRGFSEPKRLWRVKVRR
jgi:class 3 adenylate cyclase